MGQVNPDEIVTRFMTGTRIRNYVRADNTVKHQAFLPSPSDNCTSVFRTDDLYTEEIIEIGHKVNKQLLGYVNFIASIIYEAGLDFDPNDNPPKHADIIEWPDNKEDKIKLATQIANSINNDNIFEVKAE